MSEDEWVVGVICGIVALIYWAKWFFAHSSIKRPIAFQDNRLPLLITPPVCAAALYGVLKAFASFDVRDSTTYLAFYMGMGAAWVGVSMFFLRLLGVEIVLALFGLRRHSAGGFGGIVPTPSSGGGMG